MKGKDMLFLVLINPAQKFDVAMDDSFCKTQDLQNYHNCPTKVTYFSNVGLDENISRTS